MGAVFNFRKLKSLTSPDACVEANDVIAVAEYEHGQQQLEKRLCALRDEDYANLELRVLANDAAYVAAMERAYPHLKGEVK